ncbi:PAAR domain-containing protein [Stenotrophomonas maltophilia]|uniref:PAAR domain-containing protein n=1 Tax=Stenotrophomonas maltophilia TaxID=40324 RepID=UPI0034D40466
MSRMLIVVGDALQTGGSVLTGSPHTDIEGRAVARVGDRVICARHGPGSIVSGDATLVIDGQPVARDGDRASCGCALVSGKQQRAHVVAGGGGRAGAGAGVAAIAAIVAPLLKPTLQTPPFAAPGTAVRDEDAPQCWVADHDAQIDRDVDGRYYEAYDANGDKHDYPFQVSYRIDVPLQAQGEVVVSIKVQVMPKPGVTAAEVAAVKARMERGIDQFWNGRFTLDVHDPACGTRSFPIRYEVRWVQGGSDYRLIVHRTYDREQVEFPDIDVSVSTTAWTFAHEFAHTLGVPDEYSYNDPDEETVRYVQPDGTLDPEVLVAVPDSRELTDPAATIMNSVDCAVTRPRHAWNIAREVRELLSREIGREITCTVK